MRRTEFCAKKKKLGIAFLVKVVSSACAENRATTRKSTVKMDNSCPFWLDLLCWQCSRTRTVLYMMTFVCSTRIFLCPIWLVFSACTRCCTYLELNISGFRRFFPELPKSVYHYHFRTYHPEVGHRNNSEGKDLSFYNSPHKNDSDSSIIRRFLEKCTDFSEAR